MFGVSFFRIKKADLLGSYDPFVASNGKSWQASQISALKSYWALAKPMTALESKLKVFKINIGETNSCVLRIISFRPGVRKHLYCCRNYSNVSIGYKNSFWNIRILQPEMSCSLEWQLRYRGHPYKPRPASSTLHKHYVWTIIRILRYPENTVSSTTWTFSGPLYGTRNGTISRWRHYSGSSTSCARTFESKRLKIFYAVRSVMVQWLHRKLLQGFGMWLARAR